MTFPHGSQLSLRTVLTRWDALVEHWDLGEAERTSLIGEFRGGAVGDIATYSHPKGEERMRLLVELGLILDRVHGEQRRTRFWLRAPNRHLGGASPIEVMASSTAWMRWMVDHVGLAT